MRVSPQTPPQAHDASSPAPDLKRRRFLMAMSAGGAGAVAAAAPARAVTGAVTEAATDAADGYRETDHVKRYYDSTRL